MATSATRSLALFSYTLQRQPALSFSHRNSGNSLSHSYREDSNSITCVSVTATHSLVPAHAWRCSTSTDWRCSLQFMRHAASAPCNFSFQRATLLQRLTAASIFAFSFSIQRKLCVSFSVSFSSAFSERLAPTSASEERAPGGNFCSGSSPQRSGSFYLRLRCSSSSTAATLASASAKQRQQQHDGNIGNNSSSMRLRIAFSNMAQYFQRLALPKRPRRQRSPAASSDVFKHYNAHWNAYALTSAPALNDSATTVTVHQPL